MLSSARLDPAHGLSAGELRLGPRFGVLAVDSTFSSISSNITSRFEKLLDECGCEEEDNGDLR